MLALREASLIVDAALTEARAQSFMPLAVAVLDVGGNLVAFKREDGAGIARFDIAFAKAWGALGMGMGSRAISALAEQRPGFVATLGAATGGRLVASPGGVLIAGIDGAVVGAVGISGDTGDNDEICAIAAITAAGFGATPGKPA